MISKDALWKGVIEDLFEDFLNFFFPNEAPEVDFSKKIVFLDKELDRILTDNGAKRRRADKLIKIYLKSGHPKRILVHVEQQGYHDGDFNLRMFQSFYRIFDRHKIPITAIAIYTSKDSRYYPDMFEMEQWGTKIQYHFKTYNLMEKKLADFDGFDDNPFAIIMRTAWLENQQPKSEKKEGKETNRDKIKFRLIKDLLESGISKKKSKKVLNFIWHYYQLHSKEEMLNFEKSVKNIIKKPKTMGIIEAIKEELRIQAIAEGLAEGREKGHAEGHAEGVAEGTLKKTAIMVYNLLVQTNLSFDKIADLAEVEVDFVIYIKDNITRGWTHPDQWTEQEWKNNFKKWYPFS